jgi:hypothetical protein
MKNPYPTLFLLCCVLILGAVLVPRLRAADDSAPPSTAANARPAASKPSNPRFDRLDANGDGRISRQEYLGSVRDKKHWWQFGKQTANTDQNSATPEMFSALDRNADGYLTDDELNTGQLLEQTRGDNGEGASTTRNVHPPGDPNGSQKTRSETAADKRAEQTK